MKLADEPADDADDHEELFELMLSGDAASGGDGDRPAPEARQRQRKRARKDVFKCVCVHMDQRRC